MTTSVSYLVDTNILLRFFVPEQPVQAEASKRLIQNAAEGRFVLEIPFVTIAEAVHTLRTFYRVDRTRVANQMLMLLKGTGIRVTAPAWILEALAEYGARNVSFGDACLAAEARAREITVASFDRDFDSFTGVVRFDPSVL